MKVIVEIDIDSLQARQFVEYAGTLPFVKIEEPRNAWEDAIAEGAVTVDEFVNETKRQITTLFKKNA